MKQSAPPLRILVLALGGEGGGVLMNWIVEAARKAGHLVQATSVPGVAQRTGATSYYIEIDKVSGTSGPPVMSLFPIPARVDIVLASELVETARALEAGFVSPQLTTLIASTSRVFTTNEKIEMGDGRYGVEPVKETARALSKHCFLLDLEALARKHDTFISATMFGALSGSGALPWTSDISRAVLGAGGATASLKGFDAAHDVVVEQNREAAPADEMEASPATAISLPSGSHYAQTPESLQAVIQLGFDRVRDFQDHAYGQLYLERTNALLRVADIENPVVSHALEEACRRLALWMAYEDIARVADLKTRATRFETIRAEVELEPGQILKVTDYLKPRSEEIAAVLPAGLGRMIMRRVEKGGGLPFMGRGVYLRSTGVFGYYLLRAVATMRRFRKRSLRYTEEQQAITTWLEAMRAALQQHPPFAAVLAELPRVLKGYSDTQLRGQRAYSRILDEVVLPAIEQDRQTDAVETLRTAIGAALADDKHVALDDILRSANDANTGGAAADNANSESVAMTAGQAPNVH